MATVKNGAPMPMRTFEAVIEVIYEAHVATGWLIEPFFQYVFAPLEGFPIPTTRSA